MNSDEAREMVKGNPYSFLHVDRAEVDLDPSIDIHDKRVYEKARENLNKMIIMVNIFRMKSHVYIYIDR